MDRLAGGVGAGVADDDELIAVQLGGVRDEHDVLVPAHELPLAGGPAHDRPPTPASICFSTSASYAARSTLPLGRYGVLRGDERVSLTLSTLAVVDFIVLLVHALVATHCGSGEGLLDGAHANDAAKRASAAARGGAPCC